MNAAPTKDRAVTEHSCSVCKASFTRKTHLTRHLRSHMNQRSYVCALCTRATFTRSDLLARHVKRCSLNPNGIPPPRKKSCLLCIQRKVKCDLQRPCAKCAACGMECNYAGSSNPEADTEPRQSYDPPSYSKSVVVRSLHSSEGCSTRAQDWPTEYPPEAREERFFTEEHMNSTHPSLGTSNLNDEMQSVSIPSTHSTLLLGLAKNSNFSEMAYAASPSVDSEFTFDSLLSNGGPLTAPNASPFDTMPESNRSVFEDFLNQLSNPSSLDSLFPSFSAPSDNAMVETSPSGPDLDRYLASFFSFHCRQFPFVHLPTWCHSSASPLLLRAMRASGARHMTGSNAEEKAAQKYVFDTLQSGLRQEIFREFIDTPVDDIDAQVSLIFAQASLQTLGLFHYCPVERNVSAGYHGMMVTMMRKSSLAATLERWDLREIETAKSPQAWTSWARYETMKRVQLLVYLHDTMMPVLHNLPSCFEENELYLRLPCDDALWEAPNAQRWAALIAADPSSLCGVPLHAQLAVLLSPRADVPTVRLNRFACFVTLHALLRAVALERGSHAPLQRALGQWCQCWRTHGARRAGAGAGEQPGFRSGVLPPYWLAQLLVHVDSAGHMRTVKRWLIKLWDLVHATAGDIGVTEDPREAKGYMQEASLEGVSEAEVYDNDRPPSWIPR